MPSKRKRSKKLKKPDPFTAAAMERVEQAMHRLGYEKDPVPNWGELAAAAGMEGNRLSECKGGGRRLQLGEVVGLAEVLKVRAGWLAFDEPPMRSAERTDSTTTTIPPKPRDVVDDRPPRRHVR